MSIATVVTRGYGSFGTVPYVVTAGYSIGADVAIDAGPERTHVGAARIRTLDDSGRTRVIVGPARTRTR